MEPKIIFEDDEILVLNKPAGMVVNNAETTKNEVTVQDWVSKYLGVSKVPKAFDTFGTFPTFDTFIQRSGIVHRLDKETSGILLIAKTPEAFMELQRQFKQRIVKKTYLALVHGKVEPAEGEINAPVGRTSWNRERFGITVDGKEAITKYKVQTTYNKDNNVYSLVELNPKSGRTHQIRVHMQYRGYPLVGDEFYAGKKISEEDRKWCPRVFLHAAGITFLHPKSGEQIKFECQLPEELKEALLKIDDRKQKLDFENRK
jgi:23S rRNA pseudouridine1911/1915/1917 synthase